VDWRKSSYSGAQGGDCIETASADGAVLVRDTKNPDDGALAFTTPAWTAFAASLK